MKQTAVEWYCEKSVALSEDLRTGRINFIEWFKEQADILKQAKEMEKEQIRIAYMEGAFEKMRHLDGKEFMMPTEYYNKTFKSE